MPAFTAKYPAQLWQFSSLSGGLNPLCQSLTAKANEALFEE